MLEAVAGGVEVAVALEDVGGGGELGEVFGVEVGGLFGGEDEALGGEVDGGGHVLGEGKFAEVFLGVDEAGDGAGDAGGLVADGGEVGDDVLLGVEVHVPGGGGGGFFAVVEEVGFAGGAADEHEAAAAEVAGGGVDDGEGEADGDGGVDGVAAGFEDGEAGVGGVVVDGDDHGVGGAGGEVGGVREVVGGLGKRLGGGEADGAEKSKQAGGGHGGSGEDAGMWRGYMGRREGPGPGVRRRLPARACLRGASRIREGGWRGASAGANPVRGWEGADPKEGFVRARGGVRISCMMRFNLFAKSSQQLISEKHSIPVSLVMKTATGVASTFAFETNTELLLKMLREEGTMSPYALDLFLEGLRRNRNAPLYGVSLSDKALTEVGYLID